jgi:hypothetical protein
MVVVTHRPPEPPDQDVTYLTGRSVADGGDHRIGA